ncbi:MAG TPA: hypothetical protein VG711_09490 [Phycisphaerales bacterium]|nr:hypothetical protein [Phycisphaerales bacterium]
MFITAMAACALLSGCEKRLSGTYQSADGIDQIEFRERQVYMTALGNETAGEYRVEGEHVILSVNGNRMELQIAGDTLVGLGNPLGKTYEKQAGTSVY